MPVGPADLDHHPTTTRRTLLSAGFGVVALAGCRATPTVDPSPTADGPTTVLAALVGAVASGDRSRFPADDQLWANLTGLQLTRLEWATTGATDGDRVQTRVSWSVAGDAHPADQLLWCTFAGDRLTGTSADQDQPAPLWLLQSVQRVDAGTGTAFGTDPELWAPVAERAAAAVADRVPQRLRSDWNGALVLELPADDQIATRVLGRTQGEIAATTWPEGTDPDRAPLRVVIGPDQTASLPTLGRDVLITHEAVHVATGSPLSPAPLWIVEGYADWVAYARWPAAAPSALAPLLDRVRSGKGPTGLPADADFTGSEPNLVYAAAWTACRYAAARFGTDRLADLYAALDEGGPDRVDAALRSALGLGQAAFTRAWRADLERQAAR